MSACGGVPYLPTLGTQRPRPHCRRRAELCKPALGGCSELEQTSGYKASLIRAMELMGLAQQASVWPVELRKGHLLAYLRVTWMSMGDLTKSGGGFKIDHPLAPSSMFLIHSFVEAPERKNVYDGIAVLDDAGQARVAMPSWFQVLNSNFRYQLTCIGRSAPVYIARKLSSNYFVIGGGYSGLEVSWQITGVRVDNWAKANPLSVEEKKPTQESGCYRHPELYREKAA